MSRQSRCHQNNDRLIASLKKMRDLGNTLIVVEHDECYTRRIIWSDVGPVLVFLVKIVAHRNAQAGGSQQQVYPEPVFVRKHCSSTRRASLMKWIAVIRGGPRVSVK